MSKLNVPSGAWEDVGRVGVVTVQISRENREVRMTKSDWDVQLNAEDSVALTRLLDMALSQIAADKQTGELR